MTSIAVAGWFGSDNVGDELLLHSLVTTVRERCGVQKVTVLCANPRRTVLLHDVHALQFPRLRTRHLVSEHVAVWNALRECQALVLGPGTVLQERSPNLPWPGTIPLFFRLAVVARLAGTPIITAGIGVREGGTVVGRRLVKLIGAMCAAVSARDERSRSLLSKRGVVVGDVACTVDYRRTQERRGRQTLFSVRPFASDGGADLAHRIGEVARRLHGDGSECVFMPMALGSGAAGENDLDVYRTFLRNRMTLGSSPLEPPPFSAALSRWLETWGEAEASLVVRLHAAVVSVGMGVPTVGIAYEEKVAGFFAAVGLEDFVLSDSATSEEMYDVLETARSNTSRFDVAAAYMKGGGDRVVTFLEEALGGASAMGGHFRPEAPQAEGPS